jgi:hypothetical protein
MEGQNLVLAWIMLPESTGFFTSIYWIGLREVGMNKIFQPEPGEWKRVLIMLLLALFIILAVASAFWTIPTSARAAEAQALDEKPAKGWVICKDLGIGPVPGLLDYRQRFKLCHPSGWEVRTYCTYPNYPAPRVGASCVRSGDIYTCGSGVQRLREYSVIATPPAPVATTTPTATGTPAATSTPTATATATSPAMTPTSTLAPRPRPGGPGNLGDIAVFLVLEGAIIILVGAGAVLLVNKLRGKP